MISHLCAATPALYILWIIMAQIAAGQEDREKTTALKDLLSRIDLDELMKKDEPPFTFPKTLEEFEYAFNEYGQLRHLKTGEPFVFNAREDLHRWNQKRYEALGEIITQYVYELLEKKCNMTKQILPEERTDDEPTSFIYLSPDALSNPSKLLVLIQGSGVVRAGQWARRLIINQDLDSGTQIPFITRAMEEGYGVMVLNPNENYLEVEKSAMSSPLPSPTEPSDEPAEKRERKDDKEGKKKREFYEKYRNPQKETETERIPIRVTHRSAMFWGMLVEEAVRKRRQREGWKDRKSNRRDADEDSVCVCGGGGWLSLPYRSLGVHFTLNFSSNPVSYFLSAKRRNGRNKRHIHGLKKLPKSSPKAGWLGLGQQALERRRGKKEQRGQKTELRLSFSTTYFYKRLEYFLLFVLASRII
ncbi:cotranscriptional regulator ARB2A homolog isoform X2 [Eleginops maclovinus]|uniref:cotranscriptional regulator ARB2A homolog isoform X2 n=1 Tax=Eleginops maclovinus TaxID=56733 RepID=UPI0030807ECA